MDTTDRESLEEWLKRCHDRKEHLGVAGMLLLFTKSNAPADKSVGDRVDSLYQKMTAGRSVKPETKT